MSNSISINEVTRCYADEQHFIENYVQFDNPFSGISKITLTEKQKNLLGRICVCPHNQIIIDRIEERQIGVSSILVGHALWLAVFFRYQRIVFINKTNNQSREPRAMFLTAWENLPEMFKSKIITNHKHSTQFDNGSWIHYTNSNPENLRGFTSTLVILNDFETYKEEWQHKLRQSTHNMYLTEVDLLAV